MEKTINQKNKQEIDKIGNQIRWQIEELMNQNMEIIKEYKTALIDDDGCVTGYTIKVDYVSEIFTNNDPY